MNSTDEQRFFDLAMKFAGGQSSEAERSELNSLIASQPELKAELEKLQKEARLAREVMPLVAASQDSSGEFPGYARERLQTKVRERLRERKAEQAGFWWRWRWFLGLASGAAALVLVILALRPSQGPIIEIAMFDAAGPVRGSSANEENALREKWAGAKIERFESEESLRSWEANWPANGRRMVRVVYDRTAGEVRVMTKGPGVPMTNVFMVETNLTVTLEAVDEHIRSGMK